MKHFILLGLFLSISFGMAFSQKTIVPSEGLKSKKPVENINTKPDTNKEFISTQPDNEKNTGQYLEYRTDENKNQSSNKSIQDDPITSPIVADGYTDPNYETNKQKSEDLIKQLNTPVVLVVTDEEQILDLQNKIKLIKDGKVTDPTSVNKLSAYEDELQSLLNKK